MESVRAVSVRAFRDTLVMTVLSVLLALTDALHTESVARDVVSALLDGVTMLAPSRWFRSPVSMTALVTGCVSVDHVFAILALLALRVLPPIACPTV